MTKMKCGQCEHFEKCRKEMTEKEIGYADFDCPNCGRHRVVRYESGLEICEKCDWCIQTKQYWDWE